MIRRCHNEFASRHRCITSSTEFLRTEHMPRSAKRSSLPARTVSSVPAAKPVSNVAQPAPQQPRQPGLFGQMAATAAGVAIGSTVVGACILATHILRKQPTSDCRVQNAAPNQ